MAKRELKVYELRWSPTGQKIGEVKATTAKAAKRKAPAPYRRYLGEIYTVDLGRANSSRVKRKRSAARKNGRSAVPAKVLAGHRRIWGGVIPPGALAELERVYARERATRALRKKKKNPAKRKAATKRRAVNGNRSARTARARAAAAGMPRGRRLAGIPDAPHKTPGSPGSKMHDFWSGVKRQARVAKMAKRKAKRKRRRNPVAAADRAAAKLYRKFHGRPARRVVTVKQKRSVPSTLANLGALIEFVVDTGRGHRLMKFKGHGVRVGGTADGGQIYLMGGNQKADLSGFPDARLPKDHLALGEVARIVYLTSKDFHNFKPGEYKHDFGEVNGIRPVLNYDVAAERLYLSGGDYRIRREGIVN